MARVCGTRERQRGGTLSITVRVPPRPAVVRVCVCYGSTERGTRTGHASGTRNRHGGATRGRVCVCVRVSLCVTSLRGLARVCGFERETPTVHGALPKVRFTHRTRHAVRSLHELCPGTRNTRQIGERRHLRRSRNHVLLQEESSRRRPVTRHHSIRNSRTRRNVCLNRSLAQRSLATEPRRVAASSPSTLRFPEASVYTSGSLSCL
jgi:hypothetical protein